MSAPSVRGQRFSVIGGARSGVAVARLLHKHGAQVFVSDSSAPEKMAARVLELQNLGIEHEVGAHTARVLESEVIVLSPGVPIDAPIVRAARDRKIKVVGELEVASWFCPAPIIAVTGTNGKTTTTALLGRIIADARRPVVVGGNIGTAFSQVLEEVREETIVVLEVSSFQLDTIERFRPRVAVLLNITPDHLDRYEQSFDNYIASKCRIFMNLQAGDIAVYNHDDAIVRESVHALLDPRVRRLPFSTTTSLPAGGFVTGGTVFISSEAKARRLVGTREISIKGEHNLYNALAASLAAHVMGIPIASLRATLRNFKGVEHRLEFVREVDGVAFVNDSKATNVDSVWYALQSFDRPLVVLIGGRDKGNDYSRLTALVKKHARGIVAIGESAGKVVSAFSGVTHVVRAESLEEAIGAARKIAQPGDVVLLSPACASFDWFENYEHRGRVFKDLVARL